MKHLFKHLNALFFLLLSLSAEGQVRLPRLISSGMVLQRDARVNIWGWASPNEQIEISFLDSVYSFSANQTGDWKLSFNHLKAGGPYTMKIAASNEIVLDDILIGDVWVCSGQSNMELPMRRVEWVYKDEIETSTISNIRQFVVPQKYNFNEAQKDYLSGSWVSANSESIRSFSAVAYFFARELFEKYKVPIGLISASVGGSPAEAWMSEEALKRFPVHYAELQKFKDTALIKTIEEQDNQRINAWYKLLQEKDEGYRNPAQTWRSPSLNTTGWQKMNIPGYWTGTPIENINGVVWFRRNFEVPKNSSGKEALLVLGRIVDADSVFINGKFVGTTSYQYPPRRYKIPAGLLKEGSNAIVVRLISNSGTGGFVPDKKYEIVSGTEKIHLKGEWLYKPGAKMEPLGSQTFIRWKPAGLYNGLIHPLHNYTIKGVIWYQGESNAENPSGYGALFSTMINDWRKHWQLGDFPFLYVQLANFMESKPEPSESNWALLREAQLKTLTVPNTAMAVTIDIGERNDIHPLNKKEVGRRLALAAFQVAYQDKNTVGSGPLFDTMMVIGNKAVLSFTTIGSGLVSKGGALQHFAVAGADKKFVWAKATIRNNQVIVWNENIPNPLYVRYAWADNPQGANLYNKENLPASPFRTDAN